MARSHPGRVDNLNLPIYNINKLEKKMKLLTLVLISDSISLISDSIIYPSPPSPRHGPQPPGQLADI